MKRKFILTLTSLALTLTMSVPAFAGTLTVSFDGVNKVYGTTENIEGTTIVDGKKLANDLRISYDYDVISGRVKLSNGQITLTMYVDDKNATLNDEEVILPVAPTKLEDGTILLPLRFVAESFGFIVGYDNETHQITVANENPYSSVLDEIHPIAEDTKVYTYDEALEKTLSSSSDLKALDRQFDELEEQLTDVNNSIQITPNFNTVVDEFGTTVNFYSGAIITLINSRETLENAIALEDETKEVTELGLELSLMSALSTLEGYEISYLLSEDSLELQQQDFENNKIKNSLGLVSDNEITTQEREIEEAKIALEDSKATIESAQRSVNSLLGEDLTDDIYVEYNITVEDSDIDVEKVVKSALYESLSIKSAQNSVDTAENALDYVTSSEDKAQKERALSEAQSSLKDAKEKTEQSVRSTYASFEKTINKDKTLKSERDQAVDNYNTAVTSYNLGYITDYELQGAELAVKSAEAQILLNELTYNAYLFQLENPMLF